MLFVRQSTHDELRGRHSKLLWQWNSLVGRVNELGGEALLSGKKHRLEIEGLKKSSLSGLPESDDTNILVKLLRAIGGCLGINRR